MANWRDVKKKKRATGIDLYDPEVQKALVEIYGKESKPEKASFLERLSAGLSAFEPTDDILKTLKAGQGSGYFWKNYLSDIPRTLGGAFTGNKEMVDPKEGHGAELLRYLGVKGKLPAGIGGAALDIVTDPTTWISGGISGGAKGVATKGGKELLKQVAKEGPEKGAKTLIKIFGDDVAEGVVKRTKLGTDISEIAQDLLKTRGKSLGLYKNIKPGLYAGYSAGGGKLLVEGKIPGYIGRVLENPLVGPFQVVENVVGGTKLGKGIVKASSKLGGKLGENLVWGKAAKDFSESSYKNLTKVFGKSAGADMVASVAADKVYKKIKALPPDVQKDIGKTITTYIEVGAGLPQSTTIGQALESIRNAKLISKDSYKKIRDTIQVGDEMGLSISKRTIGELAQGAGKDLFGDSLIKRYLGEAAPYVDNLVKQVNKQEREWETFLSNIGHRGGTRINTLEDLAQLQRSINSSKMSAELKDFYNEALVRSFRKNIEIKPYRASFGLKGLGEGYFPHVYDFKKSGEIPEFVKKNLIDKKTRTLKTLAEVDMYNEMSTRKLVLKTGAEGLVEQIGYKEGQDFAVRQLHDAFLDIIEQAKLGIDPAFKIGKEAPKEYVKTGIKMLDDAGVVVKEEVWKTFENSMSFLLGKSDFGDLVKVFDGINSVWRGFTTAWTLKFGKVEIPVNPAFFVRNWVNNKFGAVLYGGVNPVHIPQRYAQSLKIYRYIKTGKGGGTRIGNWTVRELSERFVSNGGMGGTNVSDISARLDSLISRKLGRALWGGERTLAEATEVGDRIMVFLDQKLKNASDIDAMNKMRFSIFDYGQLTDFEKQAMKPMFGFYTWNKKNLESFFSILANDPKKLKIFDNVFDNLSQVAGETNSDIREILPEYLDTVYNIAFGNEDKVGVLYGFSTHPEAVGDIIGEDVRETAQQLGSQLSPVYRIILEKTTDFNMFKNRKISEDTSGYQYRNLPKNLKNLLGIEETEYITKDGNKKISYKMDPDVKYVMENFRPINTFTKWLNLFTDEGLEGEFFYDFLDVLSGMKFKQYDVDFLRRQKEKEQYLENMKKLMDSGIVNKYETYYIPKEKRNKLDLK